MLKFFRDFFRGFVEVCRRTLNDTAYEAKTPGEECGKLFAVFTTLLAAIACVVAAVAIILLVFSP